jgi:hypothetical protein
MIRKIPPRTIPSDKAYRYGFFCLGTFLFFCLVILFFGSLSLQLAYPGGFIRKSSLVEVFRFIFFCFSSVHGHSS